MHALIDSSATALQFLEHIAYPSAKILHGFRRSIQLDLFSCGAHSVYSILTYFKEEISLKQVVELLKTNQDGTNVSEIKLTLERKGLRYRIYRRASIRHLISAIDEGNPVLITAFDDAHFAVVYGYSRNHIFVMNPSIRSPWIGGMGSIWSAIEKKQFEKIWDHWGLVVSRKSR